MGTMNTPYHRYNTHSLVLHVWTNACVCIWPNLRAILRALRNHIKWETHSLVEYGVISIEHATKRHNLRMSYITDNGHACIQRQAYTISTSTVRVHRVILTHFACCLAECVWPCVYTLFPFRNEWKLLFSSETATMDDEFVGLNALPCSRCQSHIVRWAEHKRATENLFYLRQLTSKLARSEAAEEIIIIIINNANDFYLACVCVYVLALDWSG